jgi:hypothetical protein
MNGSKGYRASDANENPPRREVVLSLKTVSKMLPLVERIVTDILARQRDLFRLQPEEERLDRNRRTLDWPGRQRRYQVKEEVVNVERSLAKGHEELDELGLVLLDSDAGRVGFPTIVNNRPAFFSWQLGEDGLHSWHFAEETVCRPIPAAWYKELQNSGKN